VATPRPPINFQAHTLVQFGGSIVSTGEPLESWTCGVRILDRVHLTPLADPESYLNHAADRINSWFRDAVSGCAPTARLDYVKANNIGTNGKYLDASTTHQRLYSSFGGANSLAMPSIMSLCLTWRTNAARGRSSRGRIYLPNYTFPVMSNGSMTLAPVQTNNAILSGITLLNAIAGDDTVTFSNDGSQVISHTQYMPIVASAVDHSVHEIRRVEVGSIYDVQRRRKSGYAEVYNGLSWPVA
jgi:hypothetical protein